MRPASSPPSSSEIFRDVTPNTPGALTTTEIQEIFENYINILIDFSLTVKAATLIFMFGSGLSTKIFEAS